MSSSVPTPTNPPSHNDSSSKSSYLSPLGAYFLLSSADEDGTSAPKSHRALKRHAEFCFDNTLIAIQVEDTLFNVHKYQLLKSETFSDMFKVPRAKDGEPEEGSSLDHPIVMEGVSASDFEALLKVLYASHFSTHQPEPEASLIIPAFRLANMWNFSDLRGFLLPVAEKHLNDIDRILFAREFDIKDWLVPAHMRLCERKEKLTTEEARELGVDSVLLIARLGQQNSHIAGYTKNQRYCDSCSGFIRQGYSGSCYGCNGSSGQSAYLVRQEPGSYMNNINNAPLETEINNWVQAGCVFQNE